MLSGASPITGFQQTTAGYIPGDINVPTSNTWTYLGTNGQPTKAYQIITTMSANAASVYALSYSIGIGEPGSEVEIFRWNGGGINSSGGNRTNLSELYWKSLPQGTKFHAKILAPVTTDGHRFQIMGYL
jgi:hypothetical protein